MSMLPTRASRALELFPIDVARDFDAFLNRVFNSRDGGQMLAPYAVDIREDTDKIYVEAEMPGFRKDEIDITLENSVLTIQGERKTEKKEEQKDGQWLLNERRYSRFLRSFTLPPTADEKNIAARLHEGVLMVTIGKREEAKPRKVQVS